MPRSFLIKKSPGRVGGSGTSNGVHKKPLRTETESENKDEHTSAAIVTEASKGPFDLSTKLRKSNEAAIKESIQLTPLQHLKVPTPPPGTTLIDPASKTDEECSPKYGTPLEPLNPNTPAPMRSTWNRSPVVPYLPSDAVYHYQRHPVEVFVQKPNGYHGPPFLVPPPLVPVSHAQPPTSSPYRVEQLSPLTRDETLYYCDNSSSKSLSHHNLHHQDMYNTWTTDAKAVVPSPPPSSSDGEYTMDVADDKKRKSDPPRYQCCDCNKSYSTYSGLSKHKQFHCLTQTKKSFNCKYCDKVYVSLGALKMHIRTHTLPCKCKLCGKAFSRPWLLQGHIRTHTGEKPFACPHCSRAFADRSNLRAHLQTHSDVKKYSCKTCSKTFSRMSLLLKHEDGGCAGSKTV